MSSKNRHGLSSRNHPGGSGTSGWCSWLLTSTCVAVIHGKPLCRAAGPGARTGGVRDPCGSQSRKVFTTVPTQPAGHDPRPVTALHVQLAAYRVFEWAAQRSETGERRAGVLEDAIGS
ncbi:hypothetical protein CapIbe_001981 [Capra ibex]